MSRVNPRFMFWQRDVSAAVKAGKLTLEQAAILICAATDKFDYWTGAGSLNQQEVADELGVSVSHVRNAFAAAKDAQLIERTRKARPESDWQVLYPPWPGHDQTPPGKCLTEAQTPRTSKVKHHADPSQTPRSGPDTVLFTGSTEDHSQSLREQLSAAAGTEIDESEFNEFLQTLRDNGCRSPVAVITSRLKKGEADALVEELRAPVNADDPQFRQPDFIERMEQRQRAVLMSSPPPCGYCGCAGTAEGGRVTGGYDHRPGCALDGCVPKWWRDQFAHWDWMEWERKTDREPAPQDDAKAERARRNLGGVPA